MTNDVLNTVPLELYIDGQWLPASDGGTFTVYNPANEEALASVASATEADALKAVDAAYRAGETWSARAPRERAEILRKAFELMTERKEEIAALISLEEGKTRAEALGEVAYAAEFFRWYAEEAVRDQGMLARSPAGANNILVQHQPVGVCLLITPWNFPAAMGTRKIAPALAAGCTTILKPASETPLTALLLAGLLEEAGVPAGVVNVIPSRRSSVMSNTILGDERVRKVSFTGSTEVGRLLLAKAGERVVNCSMELGGNAPFVVLDDADMDVAIESAMVAKMRNAGESCIGANRFYVHSSIIDEFSRRLAEEMGRLKVGHGLEQGVDVGPLVNASTRDKVAELVDQAVAQGAKVLTGGEAPEGAGFFYKPTVLTNIPDSADISRTEIFGPVAAIYPFETIDEVVDKANDTEFGLAAYVIGRDVGRALSVASRIDAGILGVNRGFVSDPAAPFGGFKQSGIGREGSQDGLHEFIEKKYIAVDW
ncbi:NAD-dependent succinate-semialdehyde dehydrogenase [Marinobacterium nitratireducens]|uniref:NAD-dependent succinate-semialdehyde dehydrogenase n=1 Tax=Marinobacterium nitratireducens TaxID=518897 RepID=A0A917ZMY0_9GAMM|nr:NAD-dependent succinate-semialdehyde dehydrogenase [Marinobacterium nitratireducens]GGO86320.1 NAD-dependent succinate-semialdehyde dehydrogenase [Marinobacterium nitratireducens]